jgi:hypothetical protein
MTEYQQKFINELEQCLRETNTANCAVKIDLMIEKLGHYARQFWIAADNFALWAHSGPIWREIRKCLSRVERLRSENEATELWAKSGSVAENAAFLASLVVNGEHSEVHCRKFAAQLRRYLSDPDIRQDPALQLLAHLILDQPPSQLPRPYVQKEKHESFLSMSDVQEPTLTARSIGEAALCEAPPGPSAAAIDELFSRLGSDSQPRAKLEALCQLQSIGGCSVSSRLGTLLPNSEPYLQCRILHALDDLAGHTYRKGNPEDSDQPDHQLETIDQVLAALSELENRPVTTCIREAVYGARESVALHRNQCIESADPE